MSADDVIELAERHQRRALLMEELRTSWSKDYAKFCEINKQISENDERARDLQRTIDKEAKLSDRTFSLRRQLEQMHETLTAAQESSTRDKLEARELRLENNALRKLLDVMDRSRYEIRAICDVSRERAKQDSKWGRIGDPEAPQDAMAIPFGCDASLKCEADKARQESDHEFAAGRGTWSMVLSEEVLEVLSETDPMKLRNELIQVAAVCVKCVEIIDRKIENGQAVA